VKFARPPFRRWLPHVPTAVAVLVVLAAYAFFGSAGTFNFRRVAWDKLYEATGEGYYSSLAEGFRRHHLSMAHEPDPTLKALHDPYTSDVRGKYGAPYLWDASYFEGKYYLYFSPLPVLLFYLPFRWLRNGYPVDALAAVFFCAWAFVLAFATARRALAGRKLHVPLWLWVLLIGLGNVIPWTLIHVRTYEVAICAGMAMSATWGYALLRFTESGSTRHAFWMGLWLALSIAARPNLGVLLLLTALVLPLRKPRAWIACAIPLAVVAAMMVSYNYARYRSLTEFGVTYQLTGVPMRDYKVCSLCTVPEGIRLINNLIHYLSWAPGVRSEFPFADLPGQRLDGAVSFPGVIEGMAGIGPINPLVIIACVLALVLLSRRRMLDPQSRGGLRLMGGAWLILLGLSTCWYVVARYALDFAMLMTVAAAVVLEAAVTLLQSSGFSARPMRITAIVLAVYSILVCTSLGFMGPQQSFEHSNPALYQKLSKALTAKMPTR
jgi:hypothetical protein